MAAGSFSRRPPRQGPASPPPARTARGLLAVGSLVPRISRKAFARHGFAQTSIITDWSAILGDKLAAYCRPEKLAFPQGSRTGGVLTLGVMGPLATELQHLEPQIIERINGYFGYPAVARLKFTQAVFRAPAARKNADTADLAPESEAQLSAMLNSVDNLEVREALEKLGRAVLRHNSKKRP